jgi:hypothetical protein
LDADPTVEPGAVQGQAIIYPGAFRASICRGAVQLAVSPNILPNLASVVGIQKGAVKINIGSCPIFCSFIVCLTFIFAAFMARPDFVESIIKSFLTSLPWLLFFAAFLLWLLFRGFPPAASNPEILPAIAPNMAHNAHQVRVLLLYEESAVSHDITVNFQAVLLKVVLRKDLGVLKLATRDLITKGLTNYYTLLVGPGRHELPRFQSHYLLEDGLLGVNHIIVDQDTNDVRFIEYCVAIA